MHLGNIAGLIWVVAIIIGVVSNIRKSRRAGRPVSSEAAAQAAVQRTAAIAAQRARLAQAVSQATGPPPVRVAAPRPAAPQPARVRPARPAPVIAADALTAMPFEAPAPPPPITHDHDMGLPTGVPKRLFEGRQSLIWAVIMSEVLGKPKALAVEQHLWSPQNQPPST